MNKLLEFECDLEELNNFSKKLAQNIVKGDVFFLRGDLGVGKTTFARLFINALCDRYLIEKPEIIKSPSFPIMINYPLLDYQIYHYDLFRVIDVDELKDIEIFEELKNNIIIVEWPDILINNYQFNKYYLLEFQLIDLKKRSLKIFHSEKNTL